MRRVLIILAVIIICSPRAWSQLSLQAYRDSVYLCSTEVKNARAAAQSAYAAMSRARTDFLPSLSAEASFTTDFRRTGDADLWGFTLRPHIEQILYGGGAVRASWQQAMAQYDAAIESEVMTRLNMRYAADYAYWTLSAMTLYMAATNEYVGFITSLYNIVEERFREGYVARGELLQVEARLSEARYSQIASRNNYEVALHRFNSLLGAEESFDIELENSIIDTIALPQRVSVEEIFYRRPDMRMAEFNVLAAERGVALARAQFNPRLTLGISGSWQTYSPNYSAKTYIDGALVLGVSVPIFHWGERRHAISQARSAVYVAQNNIVQLRRDAAQQEADGWSAMTSSYSQMRSSLRNLAIASENLSISTYSYNEGQATVLDVLQAQISWIQIYSNAITARFNYAVAVSEYMRLSAAPL